MCLDVYRAGSCEVRKVDAKTPTFPPHTYVLVYKTEHSSGFITSQKYVTKVPVFSLSPAAAARLLFPFGGGGGG